MDWIKIESKSELYIVFFLITEIAGLCLNSLPIVLIAFVFLILSFITKKNQKILERQNAEEKVDQVLNKHKIICDEVLVGVDNLSAVGLDKNNNNIIILKRQSIHEGFSLKSVTFKNLIEVRVDKDGITEVSTSRASQLGGALVGGAIAGGVGAIIGSSGATQFAEEKLSKLTLQIVINDLSDPVHSIKLLDEVGWIAPYKKEYKEAVEHALKWHSMFAVIINRNKMEFI